MISFSFLRRKIKSAVNGDLHTGISFGEKTIFGGGVPQSGGELVLMWETLIEQIKSQKIPVKNFLLLGVGGGMVFKVVKKYYPQAKLLGVDLDPVIVDLGKKYMSLPRSAQVVFDDAISWVKKDKRKFDLIVVDLYIGRFNTEGTRSEMFLRDLKKHLTKNGVILFNAHYQKTKSLEHAGFIKRCKKIFTRVEDRFAYPINKVILLSR